MMGKDEFPVGFDSWCNRWSGFISERTKPASGKTVYIYRRLRAARNSIKSHLKWLVTCEDFPSLGIQATTNQIEGVNSQLEKVLRVQNGMSEINRKRVIYAFQNTLRNARQQTAHKMFITPLFLYSYVYTKFIFLHSLVDGLQEE